MKKDKVIWIISQSAVLPNNFGGTRHYDHATNLAKEGKYKFYIFASSFSNFEKKDTQIYQGSRYISQKANKKIHFIWIKTTPYRSNGLLRVINNFVFAKRLPSIMKNIEKPDLILGSSPQLLSAYEAFKVSKKYRVPFIFEVRDIWPQALIELGVSKFNPLMIYFSFIEKRLMKKSDHIIGAMPHLDQYASEKFGTPLKKVTWISNGVSSKYVKDYLTVKNEKFVVTYAGTIGVAQNIENIIFTAEQLSKHDDIIFKIIGDGVEKKRLQNIVQEKSLNNIEFIKPTSKRLIFDLLRASDALLLSLKPSDIYRYGNPPNKLFDYLAAGRPIIFSSCAKNNLVNEANCGINSNPASKHALSKAILKLTRLTSAQRRKMGENAISYVRKNYTTERLSSKLKNVLDDLMT